jgi:hypothetical protein
VALLLESPQDEQADEVADVQALGRRVAAVVDADRACGEAAGEGLAVGAVVHQAAGGEVVEEGRR